MTDRQEDAIVTFASFVFFGALYLWISPFLSSALSRTYTKKDANEKADWNSRVIALVHSVIIIPFAVYGSWFDPELLADRMYNVSICFRLGSGIALGFFLLDLVLCLWYLKVFGVGFLVHAVSCVFVYGVCLYNYFVPYYSIWVLQWEISTPFLNIRYMLLQTNRTHTVLFLAMNLIFAGSFFLTRIVGNIWLASQFYVEAYHRGLPFKQTAFICALNTTLFFLNCFWFYKIIISARRKRDKGPKSAKTPQSPSTPKMN